MRVLHVGPAYGYWGILPLDCLDRPGGGQVGGGETAMLNACFGLAEGGHEVACALRCEPGRYRGVAFHPLTEAEELASSRGWDAIVSWDDATFLLPLVDEGIRLVCANQMNYIPPWAAHAPDRFVSPSRTHAKLMALTVGLPEDRFAIIPNAVEPRRFDFRARRQAERVYYGSSPDRGLHHLLRIWPRVRRAAPSAELHVYYEVDRWVEAVRVLGGWSAEIASIAEEVQRRKAEADASVVFHGAVSPYEVGRESCRAGVMAYPCDTVFFTEGFGTAVLEAFVGGAYPVVTDTDAFGEVYTDTIPLVAFDGEVALPVARDRIDTDFADRVIAAIETMRGRRAWSWQDDDAARALAARYSWAEFAVPRWAEVLTA